MQSSSIRSDQYFSLSSAANLPPPVIIVLEELQKFVMPTIVTMAFCRERDQGWRYSMLGCKSLYTTYTIDKGQPIFFAQTLYEALPSAIP